MLYKKPELISLGKAVESIQGQNKDCNHVVDAQMLQLTIGAYESDE
jgi:hypothetical protein